MLKNKSTRAALARAGFIATLFVACLAGGNVWDAYPGNPVLKPGAPGEWDAGALGSMTVLTGGDGEPGGFDKDAV